MNFKYVIIGIKYTTNTHANAPSIAAKLPTFGYHTPNKKAGSKIRKFIRRLTYIDGTFGEPVSRRSICALSTERIRAFTKRICKNAHTLKKVPIPLLIGNMLRQFYYISPLFFSSLSSNIDPVKP